MRPALAATVLAMTATAATAADELTVHAAGSLRAALTAIAQDFGAAPGGAKVKLVFGASGLLRVRRVRARRGGPATACGGRVLVAVKTKGHEAMKKAASRRPLFKTRSALTCCTPSRRAS